MTCSSHGDRDADAHLNSENVVRRATELRILADIAFQIDVVDTGEVLEEMLPHPVEGDLIDEAVVRHKANDAVAILQPVRRPSKELDVRIVQRVLVGRRRVLRVRVPNASVDHRDICGSCCCRSR